MAKMKVVKNKLKNGLRVLTTPLKNLESATVTVWVGTGSRNEEEEQQGISHFLEHMAFKGGKKYKSAKAVSEAIDAIGGEFNAGTSKHWTNFYVRSASEHTEKCFDVLSDMLLAPSLSSADIDREKGVIVEEMNMYEDTPMYKISDIFENLIYKGTRLAPDIIGTKKTVTSLTRKDFVNYRKTYYTPDNMVITVAGGVSTKKAMQLAEKYFGKLHGDVSPEETIFSLEQDSPRVILKSKKTDQVHMMLGFIGNPLDHKDRYAEGVLATALGGGMSSRLFTEVREKRGLAYSVRASTGHYIDVGSFGVHAGLDPSKIDEAIKVILGEFYKFTKKSNLKKQELDKAKGYMKGHFALRLENTKAINGFYGLKELLLGKTETPDDILNGIERVSAEDVARVARNLFVKNNLNLAIIGSFKDASRFKKIIE